MQKPGVHCALIAMNTFSCGSTFNVSSNSKRTMPQPKMVLRWFILCWIVFSSIIIRCSSQICQLEECKQFCASGTICECSPEVRNCTQTGFGGTMKNLQCNGDRCTQQCIGASCNMTCSTNSSECTQNSRGGITVKKCDANVCNQNGNSGVSKMTCLSNVQDCSQRAILANVTMTCNGTSCKQQCSFGNCNMTCLSNVDFCSQSCLSNNCYARCRARICRQNCPSGSDCQIIRPSNNRSNHVHYPIHRYLNYNHGKVGGTITTCNPSSASSATTCTQGPCVKFPCTMQCGLKSRYDSCQQHCDRSRCDAINCTADRTCNQTCQRGQCASMTCNAPNCVQDCSLGICKEITCPRNADKCVQSVGGGEMICEARSCDQSCPRGICNATCSSTVRACAQQSDQGKMNMTCAPGVETCTQNSTRGDVIMKCNADVCRQSCSALSLRYDVLF
ncbi:hypothetical protein OS493_007437 [Desmophyllum pertusum]|uniref:Uncharacterized protein n=1 Tax=Desmophyllum pertusum TaxID=174260 RepID=A0A9W9Z5U7_9CNID|nr:hypothetical protein OS493_007437 [Desmophyllum pertusum]